MPKNNLLCIDTLRQEEGNSKNSHSTLADIIDRINNNASLPEVEEVK